jgi:tRNA (cmo5U34)-methyltransferase
MTNADATSAGHFDAIHAGNYEKKNRIALAGYEACHELAACMLAASLGSGKAARILVGGAGGTAQEFIGAARLEPGWRFVGVDPSEPMLVAARARLEQFGFSDRVEMYQGTIMDLPGNQRFDAAMLIGVLHHLPGDEAKASVLKAIADRLKPDAPLILASNYCTYASQPLMLAAWGERWRMHGDTPDEVKVKLAKLQEGTDPPHSEEAVFTLLAGAGFCQPLRFFSSLYWGAWIAQKKSANS